LLPLPDNPYPAHETVEVRVGKTPYVRFDLNDYSVPHTHVRRTLVVIADENTVRILAGNEVVAQHARSYDKAAQVEDPAHLADLVEYKRQARRHRGLDRLSVAAPNTKELMVRLAERGVNLGSATASLLRLFDRYGLQHFESAIAEALEKDAPHPKSIRHILDRQARARGEVPPVPVALPDDPRVRELTIRPHMLNQYDSLGKEENNDANEIEPAHIQP
jgi:hypothetical protein